MALCLLIANAQASSLSSDQIKQTKTTIKQLQQQKNYFAANKLINALIKQDTDNPVFYFDLALNYFYNNQPIQAEQTLSYVLNNKDLSSVPEKVNKNIEVFFKKVKVAADAKRRVNNNKSKLGYSASIVSSYNDNNNLLTDDADELVVIRDLYEYYNDVLNLDPALIGLDLEKDQAFKNTIKLNVNYQSKKINLFDQNFQVNQYLYSAFGNQMVVNQDGQYNVNLNYKIEPKFTLVNGFIDSHKYPISINYYVADEFSSIVLNFNPEIDIFKHNRLGYSLSVNSQNYEQYTAQSISDQWSYLQETAVSNSTTQSVYYQFSKRFKVKYTPSIFAKLSVSSTSGDTEYLNTKALVSSSASITKKLRVMQNLQYSYFDYETSDNRTEYQLQSKLEYKINKNIKIGSKYQFKIRLSDDKHYEYNQSLFALNVDWTK